MSNIKLFESKQIRSVWNEADQKWYFSIQDVVQLLTDTVDAKQYIKRVLSRDQMLKSNWGTICTPVEMEAADGKRRKIQASDTKGLAHNSIQRQKLSHLKTLSVVRKFRTTEDPKGGYNLSLPFDRQSLVINE